MARVAVVGGGITGLSCAYFLAEGGMEPIVYEASGRVGGKLFTTRHKAAGSPYSDVAVEAGADSFLPRDDLPLELCRAVGLADELISPAVFGAYVYLDGALHKLPAGFSYGLPVRPWAARRAGFLSLGGTLRAHKDLFSRPLSGPDISMGAFARKRFGSETVDRLVDPLLAGTRAGGVDEISLAAGAREIDAVARRRGSVIRGLKRTETEVGAGSTSFVSIRGGIDRLARAMADRVPAVHKETPVDSLADLDEEHIVVTTPAFEAARLLRRSAPDAAAGLDSIRYESSVSLTFFYPSDTCDLPGDGSGVLVPSSAGLAATACTWYSQKWPDARPGNGAHVIRAFVGGRTGSLPSPVDEAALVEQVDSELRSMLRIDASGPEATMATQWDRGMPIYEVGHLERVDRIEAALPENIVLAGAALRGSGIPDCIASARRAAEVLIGRVRASR